jgi:hypothetical protein
MTKNYSAEGFLPLRTGRGTEGFCNGIFQGLETGNATKYIGLKEYAHRITIFEYETGKACDLIFRCRVIHSCKGR